MLEIRGLIPHNTQKAIAQNYPPEQEKLFAGDAVKARPKKRAKRKKQLPNEEQLDLFLSLKQSSLI